jgi:hypothetical protein
MSIGILSVDPGKKSGICLITWSGVDEELPEISLSTEASEEEYAEIIRAVLGSSHKYETFRVVCEKFTITAQTVRNSQAPYSLEQIGVLKHLCREFRYPVDEIAFQTPVDAKNMFPNPTLKAIGLWHRGGEGHALDAIRHGLLHLVRLKWVPKQILSNR